MNFNSWKFNMFRLLKLFNQLHNQVSTCVSWMWHLCVQGSNISRAVVEDIMDWAVFVTEILPSPVQSTIYHWIINVHIKISKLTWQECFCSVLRISDRYIWITDLVVPTCFLNNWSKLLYVFPKVEVFLNQYYLFKEKNMLGLWTAT